MNGKIREIYNSLSKKQPIILLLFLVWWLIWFQGITTRDLWVLDEVRYAEAVRQMHETGKYFTPHLNGEIYSDKPPLFFWYLALFERMPLLGTAFCSLACALGTILLGKVIFGRDTGFLGTFVAASSLLFIGISQVVRMDLMMLFFMLMALFFFCKGYKTGGKGFYYLIYVFLALSILTKGPLGFFIIMSAILAFLIHKGDAREILQLRLLRGIGIVILIVGGWLLLTAWEGGTAYAQQVFWKQLVGRARKSWIHQQPFYYYLLWLPATFFPWIAYLPRALCRAWKDREGFGRLMVWWAISAMLILSAISYKIFIYNLLYLPALALVIGAALSESACKKDKNGFGAESIVTGILLFILGILITSFWILHKEGLLVYPGFNPARWSAVICIILAIASCFGSSLALMVRSIRRQTVMNVIVICLLMYVLPRAIVAFIVPELDEVLSPRRLSERIKWYHEQGFEPGQYRVELGILNYYADTNIKRLYTLEEMKDFLEKNPRAVIAITDNHLQLNSAHLDTVSVVENAYIGGTSPERTYHLLIQDGKHLGRLVEEMAKYRKQGYALAKYKNNLTLLDGYLGEKLTKIELKKDIKPFLEEHLKAAMVADEYWLKKNAKQLKDWAIKEKVLFAGKYYCLLVYGEGE